MKAPESRRTLAAVAVISTLITVGMTHAVPEIGKLGKLGDGGWFRVVGFLVAIAVIVVAGRLGGWVAARGRQPRVIGEMAAGIFLGPALLGQIAPEVQRAVFPADLIPHLGLVAQLAIICFVFLLGADLPIGLLRGSGRRVATLGIGMVGVPLVCGLLLGAGLAGAYRPAGVGLLPFVLFIGTSLSVTAFPVLVRILAERDLIKTRIGTLGLATAGSGDAVSWCLLVVVVAMARGDSAATAIPTAGLLIAFAAATLLVVRPALRHLLALAGTNTALRRCSTSVVLLCAVSGAYITDWIGVHVIFGAFLVGLAMPRDNVTAQHLGRTVERGVTFVLPLFFAVIGFSLQLTFLRNPRDFLMCGLLIVVAVAGKLGATTLVARLTGLSWRESAGLGVMVNCRGLTELVMVSAGLSLGIIGPDLFAAFVVMTLVTTVMTGPLLRRLELEREASRPADDRSIVR
ncbi:cation:proton antiporter [Amycolatopsis sp. NBC_01307]|uniref:cation:proton antiporter n=1 Tax=Amycolatopsis sp. NBC_01307 TaxID=2903561 RepID=UPI002E14DA0A|nr:cation:proton antiporter [Amycolatopsis sp. NBC_01307]